MKYLVLNLFLLAILINAIETNAFSKSSEKIQQSRSLTSSVNEKKIDRLFERFSPEKIEPLDLLTKDSLEELKLQINARQFEHAYQLLERLNPREQIEYMTYLLTEVPFDCIISKKDNAHYHMVPKRISGNFLIKNKNVRDFYKQVITKKRKENEDNNNEDSNNIVELKHLQTCFNFVFAKKVKTSSLRRTITLH